MGLFGKLLGRKAGDLAAEAKKVENRDLMQAIVGGCVLVAAADGDLEASEFDKIEQLIRSNPNLQHFGGEITTTMTRFKEMAQAGFLVARTKIMREIRDIKNNAADAEEVFVNMITVAQSDGEIEPAELKVLSEVGRELGLRVQDFGIEA